MIGFPVTIDATNAPAPLANIKPRIVPDVDVAKIIRKELKAAFPTIKFSVTSKHSVNVRWTDGPTPDAVESIVKKWQGKSFDGMDDSTKYRGPFMYNGEMVQTYCYVFVTRDVSASFARRIAAAIAAYWGLEAPDVVEGWVKPTLDQERECQRRLSVDWGTLIYRASRDRSSVCRVARENRFNGLHLVEA